MREFLFFKQLDPSIEGTEGLLFVDRVKVHEPYFQDQGLIPSPIVTAAVAYAEAAPGRVFEVQEQGVAKLRVSDVGHQDACITQPDAEEYTTYVKARPRVPAW